jgi:hypothetical protein
MDPDRFEVAQGAEEAVQQNQRLTGAAFHIAVFPAGENGGLGSVHGK